MEEKHLKLMTNTEIEKYRYSNYNFVSSITTWKQRRAHADDTNILSTFDRALQVKWREKMDQGLFRYPLQHIQTRILPGQFKYVAQLNIQRSLNRRKPEHIWSVQQKFDPSQFNYNKIKPEEILFQMSRSASELAKEASVECKVMDYMVNGEKSPELSDNNGANPQGSCAIHCDKTSILVVINVSPLEFGHVLLIPDPLLCLPQILTQDLMEFGMESILLSSHPGFRVGFNSLGGLASVNHLHMHGFYLDHELLVESFCGKPLCPKINFHVITSFPAPGFFFYTDGSDLKSTACNICKVTDFLVARNIAHNLFVTRGSNPNEVKASESRDGIRVIIWARKPSFGAKEVTAFNVALCELAGHLPIYNEETFNSISEDSVISIINKYLLAEEEFAKLTLDLMILLRN